MTQKGSPKIGDVKNWDQITDAKATKIAAATTIGNGSFVYQDVALGLKIATSTISVSRVRFVPTGFNNSAGVLGDRELESIKSGAIVVCHADGAIVVDDDVEILATTDGTQLGAAAATPGTQNTIARYLGHVGEVEGTDNDPTDAVDNDLILVRMY